ncbi:MAG: arginine--tRNA ligase [Bacteroidetes bacterium]|nr:arginine--tRNA ligase [Bacteroidota bacterium]
MIEEILTGKVAEALLRLYKTEVPLEKISVQKTKKEFTGDFTVVVFPLVAYTRKKPEETANELGILLVNEVIEVASFNVIKGFLNLSLVPGYWKDFFLDNADRKDYGYNESAEGQSVVIEFSSPNTNKPLHLGHIRNNLLGDSLALVLQANGYMVHKVNLVNDRGIHICKSMLAWKKWGKGESPESSGLKGDHLVGKYYVLFDQHYKEEIQTMVSQGVGKDEAARTAPLILEAQELLRIWEEGDESVIGLWKMMNHWVYKGFDVTYSNLGISFEKTYYESDTYLVGKELVFSGLKNGSLIQKQDGSVWCDLTDEGLDEKILLRSDGTSVYITQDLGTAWLRHNEYRPGKMIYVVGNEQNYHFDVLKLILKKMGEEWYEKIFHFSYGMVELPEGKMKSREGTVVDADDLLEEMVGVARQTTEELGKVDAFDEKESVELFRMLALGALKYFILKVDPKKNMVFNPRESNRSCNINIKRFKVGICNSFYLAFIIILKNTTFIVSNFIKKGSIIIYFPFCCKRSWVGTEPCPYCQLYL